MMASLVADYSDSSEDECSQDDQDISPSAKVKDEIKEEEAPDIKQESVVINKQLPDIKQETIVINKQLPDIKQESVVIKKQLPDIKQETVVINKQLPDIKQETVVINKQLPDIKQESVSKSTNSFTNFFISQNDDEDDEEDDKFNSKVTMIKVKEEEGFVKASQKLPSINDASSLMTGSSVFVNPFEREEQAKNKILEKHVRLTEAAPKKPAHQPMCWKFKKGKCHLGKNCRFFHDRDTLSTDEGAAAESGKSSSTSNSTDRQRSTYHPAAYRDARRRPIEPEPVDDDNYMASMKKKKRVGINDALMPPKKAYESLLQMRQKERPWTLPSAPS